ncbi:hypothetical protein ACS0PU_005352 [Formica fusca]
MAEKRRYKSFLYGESPIPKRTKQRREVSAQNDSTSEDELAQEEISDFSVVINNSTSSESDRREDLVASDEETSYEIMQSSPIAHCSEVRDSSMNSINSSQRHENSTSMHSLSADLEDIDSDHASERFLSEDSVLFDSELSIHENIQVNFGQTKWL